MIKLDCFVCSVFNACLTHFLKGQIYFLGKLHMPRLQICRQSYCTSSALAAALAPALTEVLAKV